MRKSIYSPKRQAMSLWNSRYPAFSSGIARAMSCSIPAVTRTWRSTQQNGGAAWQS